MSEAGIELDLTTKDKAGTINLVVTTADIIVHYIYNGLTKKQAPMRPNPDYVGDNPPRPAEDDIPF
jgi:hypothetical protein